MKVMINKSNVEEILWKYFEGKASFSEIQAINRWLDEDKKNIRYFASSKEAYIEILADAGKNTKMIDSAFKKFLIQVNQISEAETKNRKQTNSILRRKILQYAAVAAIIIITSLSTYIITHNTQKVADENFCEIDVPYGGRSSLILPDGSKIWLNAGSNLKYNRNFDIREREVFLDGEAFFNVEKSKHPFVVHTSHLDILVLGTTFNVKSYSEDDNIETTLVEGNIRIEQKESDQPLFLKPKQKLTYNKRLNQYQKKSTSSEKQVQEKSNEPPKIDMLTVRPISIEGNVDTEEATSWKDGKLIINNEPLEELAIKLERKYDIVFQFGSEELKKYSYSGTLRDFPLEQVLKALELTSPIKYSIKEKTVILTYNKHFKPLSN